jgi:hypothetical protein
MHYLLLLTDSSSKARKETSSFSVTLERKEINDLAHSLNNSSKSTGLVQKRIPEIENEQRRRKQVLYCPRPNQDLYKTAHMQ